MSKAGLDRATEVETRGTAVGLVPSRRSGTQRPASPRGLQLVTRLLLHALLIFGCLVFLFPIIWMVSTSLKPAADVFAYPPRLLSDQVLWSNYRDVLHTFPFFLYLRNSLIVPGVSTLGTVLTASLVAFGFARRRFPERNALFVVLLSTMMLPGIVTLIPTFVLFTKLSWVNTFLPLTVGSFFGGGAFNIFLLRQFYSTLPYDYDEAAYMDGASSLRVWAQLIVPLAKAPLATITVFSILGNWHDFMGPLIYMNQPHMRTLALGLQFFRDQNYTQYNLLMAGATLMTIPVFFLFLVAQRYFLQGILMTGLAGR
jgi:multiple sugar transport system permease protein